MTQAQVRPLQDRVLVQRIEAESKTAGGIIIPDSTKERPAEGKVVATGTGHRLQDGSIRALEVKTGDRVMFGKYAGTEIKVGGTDYIIMKEDDILGVVVQ